MNRAQWAEPAPWDQVRARAIGRRRYNRQRQSRALMRRLCLLYHLEERGIRNLSELARLFGVHRSTILRDVQALWPRSRPVLADEDR